MFRGVFKYKYVCGSAQECPSGTMPIRYYAHQNNAHQELCPSAYFQGWRFAHQFFYPSFFLLKLYLFKGLIIFLGKESLPDGMGALSVSKLSETNGLYVGFIDIDLFGDLRHFQHCTGHITMASWKGRGNQYIEFARVVYCKLPTNGKQLPAFPT